MSTERSKDGYNFLTISINHWSILQKAVKHENKILLSFFPDNIIRDYFNVSFSCQLTKNSKIIRLGSR